MSYDNICKFLAESFSTEVATWLLGERISLFKLEPTELSVEPIRADSLILLEAEDLILHVEFQTGPDADMPLRMLDYRVRLLRRSPQKVVRQFVIYCDKLPLCWYTKLNYNWSQLGMSLMSCGCGNVLLTLCWLRGVYCPLRC